MKQKKPLDIILYTTIYAVFIVAIYKSALISHTQIEPGREELVLEYIHQSPTLLLQFLLFALAVIIIHITPLVFLTISTRTAQHYLNFSALSSTLYFTVSLISMWVAILAFNKQYFPASMFANILPILNQGNQSHILGFFSLIITVTTGILPIIITTIKRILSLKILDRNRLILIIVASLTTTIITFTPKDNKATIKNTTKPNIIFIGIDSTSPLHLQHNPNEFIYLKSLINSGTSFPQTITPLARTFPAWTSILSGKYPIHNGARFNLIPIEEISHQNFLPKILKRHGYNTIYAQDERKFNNLDESFGFDKIIGPSVGAAEFILTKVSDLPFLNLFLLLPYSEYIFPQIAYNRADYIHYSPENFANYLTRNIPVDKTKPLFLATHFCLAHFPYKWRNQIRGKGKNFEDGHKAALAAVQDQIKQLLSSLKKKGYLENSLLVLLSDHGESMSYPDGLWIDTKKASTADQNRPFFDYISNMKSGYSGHGTKIIDRTQYTTLLTFKGYGKYSSILPSRVSNKLASLVDIMPTILALSNNPIPTDLDGHNLFSKHGKTNNKKRMVLAETGIIFSSLTSIDKIDENSLLREASIYYIISPNNARIILKKDRLKNLLNNKHYAIHMDDWMLAFLRTPNGDKNYRHILLVHKPSGRWTLGGDRELINESPIQLLISEAKRLLVDEIEEFSSNLYFFETSADHYRTRK